MPMAWRIHEQIIRGEIDNRTRGKVTGKLWLTSHQEPVILELDGNAWRDLAGHRLTFSNPEPKPGDTASFHAIQRGQVGDMTASRKARVPDCSMEEFLEYYAKREPFPWHWGNVLYLEWFSERNGRVVIEATNYALELDTEPAWRMTEEEETAQAEANAAAMTGFMERMVFAASEAALETGNCEDEDDDEPQSAAEAEAEAYDARMNLLLDRVDARIERGEIDIEDFDKAYEEERAKLKRELGEPEDPEPTPEQIEQQNRWVEEMNAIAADVAAEMEAEKWKGESSLDDERHPLVEACTELGIEIHVKIRESGWLPEDHNREHPLVEIMDGVTIASAKLAGALGMSIGDEEWPPDPLIAGNCIVRLKKARNWLRDALSGLDSADQENLGTKAWRHDIRLRISAILSQVQQHIDEAREVLKQDPKE
jgi:hypothetical protein